MARQEIERDTDPGLITCRWTSEFDTPCTPTQENPNQQSIFYISPVTVKSASRVVSLKPSVHPVLAVFLTNIFWHVCCGNLSMLLFYNLANAAVQMEAVYLKL
jgi:hypothetical protein